MESIVEKFNAVDIDRDHDFDHLCNEFKSLGSDLLNRTGSDKSTNSFRSRFTAKFGFSVLIVARNWQILEEEQNPLPVGLEKVRMLWLLILMKEYPVIRSLSSTIGGRDEKTTSKWVYACLEEVNFLAAYVVSQTPVFHRLYTALFLIIISISIGCSLKILWNTRD